jgi:AraC-like DNA-binding protein
VSLLEIIDENPKANFDYFGLGFNLVLDEVYNSESLEEKVDLLDAFFYSRLNVFDEQRVIKAVELLFDEDISIQNLCERLKISRKTLLRLFKKHIICAPKEFSNVVKFRKALNFYQSHRDKPQLTQLAYENAYYDQSDFIKHFKKVTGYNPKKFFSNLSHLGREDTFWTILES